jgi:flagellar biosynthesis protein FlhG
VTVPEPPAIETTYRFLRAAFRRRMRRALVRDKLRSSLFERALTDMGALPAPIELVHKVAKSDKTLAEMAWHEAQATRVQLVVNQTRVRTDAELGAWMSGLVSRHYGVALDELGHVEQDDTVWLTVRRNKPLLVDSPTSKSARNVERIARRVLALATAKGDRVTPPPVPTEEPTLYAVLGVTRSASDEEIRRAYKRQREIYATGGLATVSLLDGDQLAAAQRKLDEAYDTLLDPVRRRAYDLSTFPEPEPEVLSARTTRPAVAAEQLMLQEELQREIGPDTEFTGALLRKVRESLGMEISEISAKTKIARTHLAAIEDERFEDLPAVVYARGFLVEMAKQLRLDPMQVQKTYLRRMREELSARGKEIA